MKKLILFLALMNPVAVSAECVKYAYEEVKDMTQTELRAAMKANSDGTADALNNISKYLENGDKRSYRKTMDEMGSCGEQFQQLDRMWQKKFPGQKVTEEAK